MLVGTKASHADRVRSSPKTRLKRAGMLRLWIMMVVVYTNELFRSWCVAACYSTARVSDQVVVKSGKWKSCACDVSILIPCLLIERLSLYFRKSCAIDIRHNLECIFVASYPVEIDIQTRF